MCNVCHEIKQHASLEIRLCCIRLVCLSNVDRRSSGGRKNPYFEGLRCNTRYISRKDTKFVSHDEFCV